MEKEILQAINTMNENLELLNYSKSNKDPYEMLTMKQVEEEYNIGHCKALKMFSDTELPVQRYTAPFKVQRKELDKYLSKSHDYLKDW